jgi:hypothetical protein
MTPNYRQVAVIGQPAPHRKKKVLGYVWKPMPLRADRKDMTGGAS